MRLEIIIHHRLRRDWSGQPISEGCDVLLGDLRHRVIRALAEKPQKLRKTAARKSHRRWSGLRPHGIRPIVQILAQAVRTALLPEKFLMQALQNRLCWPQKTRGKDIVNLIVFRH
jgi:hypothetical protein